MRRIATILAAGTLALVAGRPAVADGQAMQQEAEAETAAAIPSCAHFDDWGGRLRPTPAVPCDFTNSSGRDALAQHYRFAWNTFFAIGWPAAQPQRQRGIPDTSAHFGAAGRTPVWDTWKEKRELYRVVRNESGIGGAWSTQDPGGFQTFPSSLDPNPSIGMCPGESAPDGPMPRRLQNAKVENFLDETDEIDLVVLWRAGVGLPNDANLVRYQVKFNADYYDYVRRNGYYASDALNRAIAGSTSPAQPVGGIQLPASSTGTDNNGAILLKTAWMRLQAGDDASNYYTVSALYYDEVETIPASLCYRTATFGLIAIHVIRKTAQFPYFFYSTFEQKGNYPGSFFYANTTGTGSTAVDASLQPASCPGVPVPSGTRISSTLPNGCGIAYDRPADPAAGVATPPYRADRPIPARSQLDRVNAEADRVNAGTVWQNYRLVGVQTLPVGGRLNDPNPAPDQDYYLANPVVETSQRFQYFTGDFVSPRVVNVYKGHDGGGRVMMGGCMGCHGAGAQGGARTVEELSDPKQGGGTDFSFTLQNVRTPPELYGAETLADKCAEIGTDYDPAQRACVPASGN